MTSILMKTGFIVIVLGGVALLGSFMVGCSAPSQQTQAQPSSQVPTGASPNPPDSMHSMDKAHGGMHEMDLGPADADYDLRFIDGMLPHHEGAVVMAQAVQAKSKRPELQTLATAIIQSQQQEIAQMQQWRKQWYPKAGAAMAWHQDMGHMMAMSPEQIKNMQMDVDLGQADQGFDARFLQAMVPHHEGALVMAKDALNKSKRPEIQTLAKSILASQAAEIKQMQDWQTAWGKP
jgi:uncharacterized protein (DUF305 family)